MGSDVSIIFYFLHVDDAQLSAVRERPAIVWNLQSDPRFKTAKLVDIDKDYEVLAWLLSPKKRQEQARQIAFFNAHRRQEQTRVEYSKAVFLQIVDEELVKLGVVKEDPDKIPTDPLLEALEGRGTEAQREPKINFGLGAARLFKPAEVTRAASALSGVNVKELRKSFDRSVMAKFDVGGIGWLEENDDAFEKFLVPQFDKIRSFYVEAAKLGHYVLVIYQ